MAISTYGAPASDMYARLLNRVSADKLVYTYGVDCMVEFECQSAEIVCEKPSIEALVPRPKLVMHGRVASLSGDMPHGVAELNFSDDKKIPIDVNYNFTDDELKQLIDTGMYQPEFAVPPEFSDSNLFIPAYCDFVSLAPTDKDTSPLLFASVGEHGSIDTTVDLCNYRLADFFRSVFEKRELVQRLEDDYSYTIEEESQVGFDMERAFEDLMSENEYDEQAPYEEVLQPEDIVSEAEREREAINNNLIEYYNRMVKERANRQSDDMKRVESAFSDETWGRRCIDEYVNLMTQFDPAYSSVVGSSMRDIKDMLFEILENNPQDIIDDLYAMRSLDSFKLARAIETRIAADKEETKDSDENEAKESVDETSKVPAPTNKNIIENIRSEATKPASTKPVSKPTYVSPSIRKPMAPKKESHSIDEFSL